MRLKKSQIPPDLLERAGITAAPAARDVQQGRRRHELEFPGWTPPTLNQLMRGKLRARMRLGRACKEAVALACCRAGAAPARGKRRVTLSVVLGPRQRGADPDAYQKALGDALVAAGALVGDSKEWVEWAPVGYSRGPAPASRVVLEDI